MDTDQKLALLTEYAAHEPDQIPASLPCTFGSGPPQSGCGGQPVRKIPEVTHARRSNGGEITLLKTVLTTACEKNCNYCAFRAGRNHRRATMKPDEMASVFANMHKAGLTQGFFLSSGIVGGGIRTQDKLIDTAEILRNKLDYRGYLHLKIMPGAEYEQIERAMQLSTRVSINLEAPNQNRLNRLAPRKVFLDELLTRLQWAAEIRRKMNLSQAFSGRKPSLATQLVVGACGESDLELLQTSQYLYGKLDLTRIYYSRFTPITDTPFENIAPENPLREFRLYQASFLLRDYGYNYKDLILNQQGNLPLDTDPKSAWARQYLSASPIEINTADRSTLLHIPGIGPKGAQAILQTRFRNKIKQLGDLRRLGINPDRAAPFILLNGRSPEKQLSLW